MHKPHPGVCSTSALLPLSFPPGSRQRGAHSAGGDADLARRLLSEVEHLTRSGDTCKQTGGAGAGHQPRAVVVLPDRQQGRT